MKPWVSDIFKENPGIDEIILYDDSFEGFTGRLTLAKMLRQRNFDSAILFQNAFDAAYISWLSRIPERIGYKRDWRSLLLTKAIPVTKDILKQHQTFYYINLLNSIGIKTSATQPYIYLSDNEIQWAKNLIHSSFPNNTSPIIGINPGATYGSAKRWLPERFAEVIKRIIDELNGRIVIFGSPSEIEIANEIVELPRTPNHVPEKVQESTKPGQQTACNGQRASENVSHILMMAGKTNLRQLAALISECDAFITNDSGPMHLASALLVPIVAIFGSTNKSTTGPFGQGHKVISKDLPCAPCMKRECPEEHLKCMTDITADEVFTALTEVLPKGKAVFLDRDGTLIEDRNYLNSFNDLVIFPEARENLQRLKEKGFKLIGITNQSGIARKLVDEDFIIKSNVYLKDKLGIDDFYYCPHHPDEHCPCRKPEAMLILMAKMKHTINVKASYVIGDKESDVQLAQKVGATGILIAARFPDNTAASHIANDLSDAIEWILKREKN